MQTSTAILIGSSLIAAAVLVQELPDRHQVDQIDARSFVLHDRWRGSTRSCIHAADFDYRQNKLKTDFITCTKWRHGYH